MPRILKRISQLTGLLAVMSVCAQDDAGSSTQRESKISATFPGSPLDSSAGGDENKQKLWSDYLGLSQKQQQDLLGGIEQKIRSLNTLSSPGMDNPVVRARFEKYLNTTAADPKDIERYQAMARKIQDMLRRHDERGACKLLYDLSAFEWDAEIGESLAARVEVAWDMRLTQAQLDAKMTQLRKDVQQKVWNTEMMMNQESLIGSPKNPGPQPTAGGRQASDRKSVV